MSAHSTQHTAQQQQHNSTAAHTKVESLLSSPHLFQEVVDHLAARDHPLSVKVDLHPFTETTRVVVPHRLRVSERLQDRIRLQQLVLLPPPIPRPGDLGQIPIINRLFRVMQMVYLGRIRVCIWGV